MRNKTMTTKATKRKYKDGYRYAQRALDMGCHNHVKEVCERLNNEDDLFEAGYKQAYMDYLQEQVGENKIMRILDLLDNTIDSYINLTYSTQPGHGDCVRWSGKAEDNKQKLIDLIKEI